MFSLQILAFTRIKKMITQQPDLELNRVTAAETLFIFVFSTLDTIVDSVFAVLFMHYQSTSTKEQVRKVWQVSLCVTTFIFLIVEICFVYILQRYWAKSHKIHFSDPILNQEVPILVYIANRQLKRDS